MFTNECPLLSGTFFFQRESSSKLQPSSFFRGMSLVFRGALVITLLFLEPFWGGIYQKYLLDFFSGWNSQEYADFHHQLAGDQQIPPTWMTWRSRMPTPHDSSRVSSRLKRHKDVITYSKQKTRRVNSSTTNTFFLRPPILPKKFWALLWQKYHVKIMFILFVGANSRFPLPPSTLSLASCARAAWRKPHGHITSHWESTNGWNLKMVPPPKKRKNIEPNHQFLGSTC